MSDRELPNLRGEGDRLIADVAKPSHISNDIFCLVVPTSVPIFVSILLGVSGLLGHKPSSKDLQKQIMHRRWCAGRLSDA